MPSKRKKNKRRMTRVQAQRRILEEQYAANPPAKASRGTAAGVPPAAAPRQAVKRAAPAPEKIPEAVTALEVQMKAVSPKAVAAFEQSPTAAEAGAADTGAGDPPVVAEAAEAQAGVPDTEADARVISPAEASAEAPVETEILTEETANVTTETEPTHEEEAEAPAEEAAPQETEMEVAVTQAAHELEVTAQIGDRVSPVEEPAAVTEAAVEPAEVKAAADVLQVVSGGEAPEEEAEMEVLAAEEAAEVPTEDTEPITETEDAPPQSMEIQVVADAPVEEAEASVTELKEEVVDNLADDFIVTETAEAVEVAIAKSASKPETVEMSEPLNSQSEALDEPVVEPVAKAAASPTEEAMDADHQARADTPTEELKLEEPKLEVCEMPCPMQLESVEMSVESPLSGQVVPEVSIEG